MARERKIEGKKIREEKKYNTCTLYIQQKKDTCNIVRTIYNIHV